MAILIKHFGDSLWRQGNTRIAVLHIQEPHRRPGIFDAVS
jgi:hypothetical protein